MQQREARELVAQRAVENVAHVVVTSERRDVDALERVGQLDAELASVDEFLELCDVKV